MCALIYFVCVFRRRNEEESSFVIFAFAGKRAARFIRTLVPQLRSILVHTQFAAQLNGQRVSVLAHEGTQRVVRLIVCVCVYVCGGLSVFVAFVGRFAFFRTSTTPYPPLAGCVWQ